MKDNIMGTRAKILKIIENASDEGISLYGIQRTFTNLRFEDMAEGKFREENEYNISNHTVRDIVYSLLKSEVIVKSEKKDPKDKWDKVYFKINDKKKI